MRNTLKVQQTPTQQIQNKNVDMRKSSKTMQYLTPRKEFVAESRQTQAQIQENAETQSGSGTIPPCPKSLDIAPSDLLDDDEKVLKFDAFVNECLNKANKGSK